MSSEWDPVAALRRNQIESGKDLTFTEVFIPLYKQIIESLAPNSILEAGIGTGHLAAVLQGLTSLYVAVEPSENMYAHATDVLKDLDVEVFNLPIQDFKAKPSFDLVISHMCLQAVQDYVGFLEAIKDNLAPGGGYLISIPHPAFFNDYKKVIPGSQYNYIKEFGAKIAFAITLDPASPISDVPYFHRPLSKYISAINRAGLTLSYFNEVFPPMEVQRLYGEPWSTPRYLIFGGRLRPAIQELLVDSVAERLMALGFQKTDK
jgi:SAM-dependent methyltransferase